MAYHDPQSETRPSLLARIKDVGDQDAWAVFVEVYAPLVYRHGRRHGLQDSDAADLAQEVMAQVSRSIREFDYRPERGRFRDWLGAVTRTRLANHLRSARRNPAPARGGPEAVDDRPDPGWATEFEEQVLRAALARVRPRFEPETWSAFERAWVDGRPAAEVARELGVTVDSVYVAKSRVLKRLREEVVLLAEDLATYVLSG